jgi:cell division protein FtsL
MNLLLPEDQKKIRNERLARLAETSGAGLFFLALIANALLFSAYIFLAMQSKDMSYQLEVAKNSGELKRAQSLDQAINDLNKQSRVVQENNKIIRDPTPELSRIIDMKPRGIAINTMTYARPIDEKKAVSLLLGGHANTRDNLLSFVSSLEKSDVFAKVYSPVSNLLSRQELEFSLVLDLKSEIR